MGMIDKIFEKINRRDQEHFTEFLLMQKKLAKVPGNPCVVNINFQSKADEDIKYRSMMLRIYKYGQAITPEYVEACVNRDMQLKVSPWREKIESISPEDTHCTSLSGESYSTQSQSLSEESYSTQSDDAINSENDDAINS